jgi:DtxR family Mn-dependent transcriptional regulator
VRTNSSGSSPSATQEDYLRAIYLLRERAEDLSVTNIAERLGLSKSTVSERLKELKRDGFIDQPFYGQVELTASGAKVGQKITHKHRLIEVFLHQTLRMPDKEIHAEADKLEHALSDAVITRLGAFLDHPKTDPHGTDIPNLPK